MIFNQTNSTKRIILKPKHSVVRLPTEKNVNYYNIRLRFLTISTHLRRFMHNILIARNFVLRITLVFVWIHRCARWNIRLVLPRLLSLRLFHFIYTQSKHAFFWKVHCDHLNRWSSRPTVNTLYCVRLARYSICGKEVKLEKKKWRLSSNSEKSRWLLDSSTGCGEVVAFYCPRCAHYVNVTDGNVYCVYIQGWNAKICF